MENHDFVTARFTNNDRTTVMARWKSRTETDANGNPIYRNENMLAEDNNALYKNVLKHISVDRLHENTVNWARAESEEYDKMIENLALQRGEIVDHQDETTFINRLMEVIDINHEADKESLFKCKLAVFEVPQVKESQDRALKTELRKAKSFREVIEVALKF